MYDILNILIAHMLDGGEAEVGDVHLLALHLVKDLVKKKTNTHNIVKKKFFALASTLLKISFFYLFAVNKISLK